MSASDHERFEGTAGNVFTIEEEGDGVLATDGWKIGDEITAVVLVVEGDGGNFAAFHLTFDLVTCDFCLKVLPSSDDNFVFIN